MSETLYLKMEKSAEVENDKVVVSDIASVWCKNRNIMDKFKTIRVVEEKINQGQRYIVTAISVIELAEKMFPTVDVSNLGETECVVEIKKQDQNSRTLEYIKVAVICLIMFFGAGFSIMSFNNDVDIGRLFNHISKHIVMDVKLGENILKTFYSVGIFIGITVFYNHFGAKKLSKDPTPIEVEMRDYEESINDTLIDNYGRKH
jgi:stage V sporulation protein AA